MSKRAFVALTLFAALVVGACGSSTPAATNVSDSSTVEQGAPAPARHGKAPHASHPKPSGPSHAQSPNPRPRKAGKGQPSN